jgi:cobaltochelatase CobS
MTPHSARHTDDARRALMLRATKRIKHEYRLYQPATAPMAPEPAAQQARPVHNAGWRGSAQPLVAVRDVGAAAGIAAMSPPASRMDEARVREIALEALAEQPGRVRVIRMPDRPDVDLPAHAHHALPDLITMVAASVHVFLVGPAGSGKSVLAGQAAKALGLELSSLSLGPTTPTTKLFGYRDAHGAYVGTPFRRAYELGGLMLIDEMDNGHPGLLAELNQTLSNRHAAFGDGMVARHESFRVVATGNTYGLGPDRRYVGRNALDAATLDRFSLLPIAYDEDLEERLTLAQGANPRLAWQWLGHVRRIREKVDALNLNVIVSPRASIEGARLLAAGLDWSTVQEARLIGSFDSATRAKVLA